MKFEKLIATLFLSREVAHRAHFASKGTGSHAEHMALGGFYDSIVEITDSLAEAYQGRNGLMDDIPILTDDRPNSDIAKVLEYHLALVEKIRYTAVDKDDAAIQSILDNVVLCYLSVFYKLRNLK